MAVLYTVAVNGKVRAADLNQIINALTGVGNYPINLTAVSDASQYALDVKNAGAGGKALIVRAADGTTLFLASGTVVQAAIDGTLQTLVGLSATQTLTNKTLTAPAISAPVITGGASLAGLIAMGAGILKLKQQTLTAAAALAIPDTGNVFQVDGNTNISSFTGSHQAGTKITLRFTGTPSLVHSASLDVGGQNADMFAGRVCEFVTDGTNWYMVQDSDRMRSGSYVGDDVAKTIVLGWRPDLVIIQSGTVARIWITLNSSASMKFEEGGSNEVVANTAVHLAATGFTIGSGSSGANDGGIDYDWFAFRI
jgi:hypothetical protein